MSDQEVTKEIKVKQKLNTSQRIKQDKPLMIYWSPRIGWVWKVFKRYQREDKEIENPYARWFCKVHSPIVPDGELGDVWIRDIVREANAVLIYRESDD